MFIIKKSTYILFVLLLFFYNKVFAQTEKWGVYELDFQGVSSGNPYIDVNVSAIFSIGNYSKKVSGFYDGNGVYKIRFSPDSLGKWIYKTSSNNSALSNKSGVFVCVKPSSKNHGFVETFATYHFKYADGKRFYPFGTTSYNWTNQPDSLQEITLKTLANAPFNKIRMCVLPKSYDWNKVEPPVYPYEGDRKLKKWDFTKPNPLFFQRLEKRIAQLDQLGIQCDLILFHPYDNGMWDFDKTTDKDDDFYLRYMIARFGAYKNVWWSLANEYDLMKGKQIEDWDRFFSILKSEDAHQRLRSIHNWQTNYNHQNPNITHVSAQIMNDTDFKIEKLREKFKKPILWDECKYEGNIKYHWGDLTPEQMTNLFWEAVSKGGYATHGETYLDDKDILWWGKGGILKGKSPERIAFLRTTLEDAPATPLEPFNPDTTWWNTCNGLKTNDNSYFLIYLGDRQHGQRDFKFPENIKYKLELIDAWNMTKMPIEGVFSGVFSLKIPTKPYVGIIAKKIN
jgi:Domain of unknown function (DUF5060)/Protein of unknown function (DUF4038)/Domain of unknown function (DUF5605)